MENNADNMPSETSPLHTYVESPTPSEIAWALQHPPAGRKVTIERHYNGEWIDATGTPLTDPEYLRTQAAFRWTWARIRSTKEQ